MGFGEREAKQRWGHENSSGSEVESWKGGEGNGCRGWGEGEGMSIFLY